MAELRETRLQLHDIDKARATHLFASIIFGRHGSDLATSWHSAMWYRSGRSSSPRSASTTTRSVLKHDAFLPPVVQRFHSALPRLTSR